MEYQGFLSKVVVLAVVGVGITIAVYGAVGVIVKADDVGVALARSGLGVVRAVGRSLVRGMPVVLKVLAATGTAAMLWVGGGILLHGVAHYGLDAPTQAIAGVVGRAALVAGPVAGWVVGAAAAGAVGIVVGGLLVAVAAGVRQLRSGRTAD